MSSSAITLQAGTLGAPSFRRDHGVRLAYAAGAMYKGIASKELVLRMARARLLSFLGAGGLRPERLDADLAFLRERLPPDAPFGCNLLHAPGQPAAEDAVVDLLLRHGVRRVEAAAFLETTPALVRYRALGLSRGPDGAVRVGHLVLAKVSRPEIARLFLAPPPEAQLRKLVAAGRISPEQAALAATLPLCDDLCVEADSGGHTDQGNAYALMPAMLRLRDEAFAAASARGLAGGARVRVGAAGGLGTPHALAAAFVLGAEFVMTGSINQCTVEAGTSDAAKDLLQQAEVQDTAIAPAGDMFELGAKVQVLRKGLFFPARANKLHELYRRHASLDELDPATRRQLETQYFHRGLDEVWAETRAYLARERPEELERAERDPKARLAQVFKAYFIQSSRLALAGDLSRRVDFQIQCGPAMGAFNQWVKGTPLEPWRARHVDEIADRLMTATADLLAERFAALAGGLGA